MTRVNELPKPDCVVCSDDSSSIATVTVRSCEETKLIDLVDKVFIEWLEAKPDGDLLFDFDGKIIYERSADMSEDETSVFNKRLTKTLPELALKPFSLFMLQVDLTGK